MIKENQITVHDEDYSLDYVSIEVKDNNISDQDLRNAVFKYRPNVKTMSTFDIKKDFQGNWYATSEIILH